MREKTNIYFLAEITKGFGTGDCILLENIDSDGNITHALIDTGRYINGGVVCKFLQKHNVENLSFLCITHSHQDHNGDTISVLNKYKVDLIIMKEFDNKWSSNDGYQTMYENIIAKAIEKDIKILGVSFESLGSDEYSPSQSDNFRNNRIKNAKKENFEYFNEKNVILKFGSSDIKIMNWEIFDSEGNLFVTGKDSINGKKMYRDIYTGENENSLGILLFQGEKKAFFPGDMNNIKKNVGGKQIGDEDRLKYEIGKIDLLKLGHHGYSGSNTNDYMNILLPNYVIITNDIGSEDYQLTHYLEKSNINYLYSTQDEYEVCAIIYNNEITLGFGSEGVKRVKDEIFYIPKSKIYANYLNNKIPVKFKSIEKTVNNWEELKNAIEENEIKGEQDKNGKFFIAESLKINLNTDNNNIYNANSTIEINSLKRIQIISKEKEIIIKRDSTFIDSPLFRIKIGIFLLGEENMKGKIKLDGNKVESTSNLIQLNQLSELSIYDNVSLCNNLNIILKRTTEIASVIYAIKSRINIYGGEISNNIKVFYLDKNSSEAELPVNMEDDYVFDVGGEAIFLTCSKLYMYGGKICYNEGINNTEIYSNKNSTNNNNIKIFGLYQRCFGIAIFGQRYSKIYLYKGEISNNYARNNAKSYLIEPNEKTITNLSCIDNSISGSALYFAYSEFEMFDDFIIQNNNSLLNTTINIEKNCKISRIYNEIKGGQIYINSSQIKIHGGLIRNSNNKSNKNINISPEEEELKEHIEIYDIGGAISFINCKEIEINNMKLEKSNSFYGGGIYLSNSSIKINNSELYNNFAEGYGGAIFSGDNNCELELYNSKILNNSTQDGSGGGIMLKTKGLIKNCVICNNKAKYYGGGIYIDGNLMIEKAKIFHNSCNENGGGICCANILLCDKNKIDSMVYDNTAGKNGNNLYY